MAITRIQLRRERKALGVRLETLGPLCRVDPSTLSRIETGAVRVGKGIMARIERVLEDIGRVRASYPGMPIEIMRNTLWLEREIRKLQPPEPRG
jgi:hypothetical protein